MQSFQRSHSVALQPFAQHRQHLCLPYFGLALLASASACLSAFPPSHRLGGSCKRRCCLRSRSFPSLQPVLESSLLPCTIPSSRFQPAEGVGRLNASPLLGGSQILVLKRRKPVASPTSTNVCVKIAIKTQSHATGKVVGAELFKEATGVASAARASSRANHMALFRAVNRGAYSAQGNARERDRSEDAGRRGGRHERSGERARRLGDQRPMQWAPGRCPLQGFRCRSRMEKTYWPPGGPPDFPGNGNTPRIIRVLQR